MLQSEERFCKFCKYPIGSAVRWNYIAVIAKAKKTVFFQKKQLHDLLGFIVFWENFIVYFGFYYFLGVYIVFLLI